MAGSDSRKASGSPKPAPFVDKDIPTANEPAVEPLRLGETVVFDPSNSFFPQTLLKPDDLRVLALKPRPPWHVRHAKALVAVVLAIGAALAYVFFLSGPATVGGAKDTAAAPAKDAKSSASATGSITPPATSAVAAPAPSVPPPAAAAVPKPTVPASPPAVAATRAPVPPPVAAARASVPPAPTAVVPARAAAASAPAVSYSPSSRLPATGRSTVTHTKAAVDAAESGKAAEAAPAAAIVAPVAPAAPPANARSGPCSEALAALGLCSATK